MTSQGRTVMQVLERRSVHSFYSEESSCVRRAEVLKQCIRNWLALVWFLSPPQICSLQVFWSGWITVRYGRRESRAVHPGVNHLSQAVLSYIAT